MVAAGSRPAGRPQSGRQREGPPPTMHASTRPTKTFPVDKELDKSKSCLAISFLRSPKVHRKSHAVVREEHVQHVPLLKASEPAGLVLRSGTWADATSMTDDETTGTSPSPPRRPAPSKPSLDVFQLPVPVARGRRTSYEGEQEPSGTRGQEAVVARSREGPLVDGEAPPGVRAFPSNRRGRLYDGEQEPDGARGQEAAVSSRTAPAPPNAPNMRNFPSKVRKKAVGTSSSTRPRSVAADAPWDERRKSARNGSFSSVLTDERSSYLIRGQLSTHAIIEDEEEEDASSRDSSVHVEERPVMETTVPSWSPGRASYRPQDVTYESTTSSEDLQLMMPDFVPTSSPRRKSGAAPDNFGSRDETSHLSAGSSVRTMSSAEIESMNAAAVAHVERGEYDEALVAFGAVLQEYVHRHGKKHATVASTYHNLGMVHSKRASLLQEGTLQQSRCRQQSLECFQAAARTARDSLGKSHPNVAVSLVRIGFLLLQARQYQNAVVTFQEALRIRLVHYGEDTPHGLVANLYNNLGVCYMHLGKYGEGRQALETALRIQRKVLHIKRQDKTVQRGELRTCLLEVADTLCNVGGLHMEWVKQQGPDARHAVEAEKAFAEALEIRTTVLGPDHALVQQVQTLHDMAIASPLPAPPQEEQEVGQEVVLRKSQAHRMIRGVPDDGSPSPAVPTSPETMRKSRAHRMVRGVPDGASHPHTAESPPEILRKSEAHRMIHGVPGGAPTSRVAQDSPETMRKSQAHRMIAGGWQDAEQARRAMEMPSAVTVTPASSPPSSPSRSHQQKGSGFGLTNIWLSAHEIPRRSPRRHSRKGPMEDADLGSHFPSLVASSASDSTTSSSPRSRGLKSPGESKDQSIEVRLREHYPYDSEESCLISDSGGISERATANFLSMLDKEEEFQNTRSPSHEIMVVRPYERSQHLTSAGGGLKADDVTKRTSSWNEAVPKTHMEAATSDLGDSPAVTLNPDLSLYAESPESCSESNSSSHEYDDGIAPLGGHWPRSDPAKEEIVLRREMLDRPDANLNFIYDAAATYLKRSQFPEALHLFQTVLDCQRQKHGELHSEVGAALHNVGIVNLRINRHVKALEYFEKASRVRKGSLGKDHHEVAVSLVKVGICYLLLHNFDMALHSFHEALSVRRHSLGTLHPATARVYNNIGCVHVELNELRDARRAFEAALDVQRNALCHEPDSGPLMFGTATTLCNLGYLYRYRGMPGKAVLVLKEALGLQQAILGPFHSTVLSTMDSLAESCSLSGSCAVALRYYNEIMERSHASRDTSSLRRKKADAILLYKMARVHRQQNDKEAELEKLDLSLRALRSIASVTTNERATTERLERRIAKDVQRTKEELEKINFDWI